MKPGPFLPPLVVAIGGAIWLGSQGVTISRIEKENGDLGDRISAERTRPGATGIDRASTTQTTRPGIAGRKDAAPKDEPIDWKEFARQLGEMQRSGGMGDMKAMIRLQQRLQAMDVREIEAALDEIAALDLPDEEKRALEQALAGPLAQKDPERALTRFLDRINDENGIWGWQLPETLKTWAEKDPAAATAWFDEKIESGMFDSKSLNGRNQSRLRFESSLLSLLVHSDTGAASLRLAKLPEDQRAAVLMEHRFSELKETDQASFARLVREQIPEKQRADVLLQPAAKIASEKGYAGVEAYLENIKAGSDERTEIVTAAAKGRLASLNRTGKVTARQIDEMRAWVAGQAPGTQDRATGAALAEIGGFNDKDQFAAAARLAEQYHEFSGNDDVLAGFLDGWSARTNKEAARKLAGSIRDEKRRADLLQKLR